MEQQVNWNNAWSVTLYFANMSCFEAQEVLLVWYSKIIAIFILADKSKYCVMPQRLTGWILCWAKTYLEFTNNIPLSSTTGWGRVERRWERTKYLGSVFSHSLENQQWSHWRCSLWQLPQNWGGCGNAEKPQGVSLPLFNLLVPRSPRWDHQIHQWNGTELLWKAYWCSSGS